MKNTIMTEKIARRGVRVPSEYSADYLAQVAVSDAATSPVITLKSSDALLDVRAWFHSGAPDAHHQGYPVTDENGTICGVVTRRDLLEIGASDERLVGELVKRAPVIIQGDRSLREAADHMVSAGVGRLIVVAPDATNQVTGILTRGDLLAAHGKRLDETQRAQRNIRLSQSFAWAIEQKLNHVKHNR